MCRQLEVMCGSRCVEKGTGLGQVLLCGRVVPAVLCLGEELNLGTGSMELVTGVGAEMAWVFYLPEFTMR